MSRPDPGPHRRAVLEALRTRTGEPIGDTIRPSPGEGGRYAILYGIGETRDGSLADSDTATYTLQLTCGAWDADGRDLMSSKVDAALLGEPIAVPGRRIHISFLDGGIERKDDDADPPILYTTPRYRLWSAPA